ncbi:MAG: L,D-transpeptidase family protein [Acidimicrobiales bacterium]
MAFVGPARSAGAAAFEGAEHTSVTTSSPAVDSLYPGVVASTSNVPLTNPPSDPVTAYYERLGGSASYLGAAKDAVHQIVGGEAEDFDHGSIFWSAKTLAHVVQGAILRHYLTLGGPTGILGYPMTDESVTPDGVGRYNHFAHAGSIYWTATTGAWSIHGAIRDHWASMGWERSVLGYPTSDETVASDTVGRYNSFANGRLYWSPSTGAWSVGGAILLHYLALGGAAGIIGYPVTDESGTPDGVGRFNHFSGSGGASIYWTPTTGAWSVAGSIRGHWAYLGWEQGPMGYPTTDETGTPDKVGRYNYFSKGASIYWTPATGAWSVQGVILSRWASLGWERSSLGYPISDEYAIPSGRQSSFQHGAIAWSEASGATTLEVGCALNNAWYYGVDPNLMANTGGGSQLVTVTDPYSSAVAGALTAWDKRPGGCWVPHAFPGQPSQPFNAETGYGGIVPVADRVENDGATPQGIFGFGATMYGVSGYSPNTAYRYQPLTCGSWWDEAPGSPTYDLFQQYPCGVTPAFAYSAEALWTETVAYVHFADIRTPNPPQNSAGIFLHDYTTAGDTAGCVALPSGELDAVLGWMAPSAQPHIAIGISATMNDQ